MADWTDWADGKDLANMSQSTTPLASAGYDVDALRADPVQRDQVMKAMSGPYPLPNVTGPSGSSAVASQPAVPQPAAPQQIPAPSSAQVSPSGNAGQGLDDIGRNALQKGLDLGGFADRTARDAATSTGPDTTALEAQRAKDAVPTPYRDPNTGQVLASAQQYAPTGMQRFGRGLKAAALGLLTGGIPGSIAGAIDPTMIHGGTAYGAPNAAYNTTEAQRQARLSSDDQQLGNTLSDFKAMTDARKQGASDARAGVSAYNDVAKQAADLMRSDAENKPVSVIGDDGKPTFATLSQGVWRDPNGNQIAHPTPQVKLDQPKTYEEMVLASQTDPDPTKRAQYAASAAEIQKAEVRRFTAGRPAATGPAIPDAPPGVTGEDYIKTLPSSLQNTVRAIGEGREAPPAAGNRSKEAQALLGALNHAYPDFDATQYPTYAATRKAFTEGKEGVGINSFGTALKHLSTLESHIPTENTGLAFLNKGLAALSPDSSQRSIDLGKWDTDANAVSNEVEKAYKGGAVSQAEHDSMMKLLDRNASPARMQSNINELKELLNGKLDSYQRQWESAMPKAAVSPLATLRQGSASPPAATGTNPPATGGSDWFSQHKKAN